MSTEHQRKMLEASQEASEILRPFSREDRAAIAHICGLLTEAYDREVQMEERKRAELEQQGVQPVAPGNGYKQ